MLLGSGELGQAQSRRAAWTAWGQTKLRPEWRHQEQWAKDFGAHDQGKAFQDFSKPIQALLFTAWVESFAKDYYSRRIRTRDFKTIIFHSSVAFSTAASSGSPSSCSSTRSYRLFKLRSFLCSVKPAVITSVLQSFRCSIWHLQRSGFSRFTFCPKSSTQSGQFLAFF